MVVGPLHHLRGLPLLYNLSAYQHRLKPTTIQMHYITDPVQP